MKAILQRKCDGGGCCDDCDKKQLQRSAIGPAPRFAPPIVHDVLRSPGAPLDRATRAAMEPRFAYDFSNVRVHSDARAAESAAAVGARAYTVGADVVLGRNAPRDVLRHELAHVVQQNGGQRAAGGGRWTTISPARRPPPAARQPEGLHHTSGDIEIGHADDPLEKEADRA